MAPLNQSTQSMIDQYKSVDGNGKYIDVIETMNDTWQFVLPKAGLSWKAWRRN